MNKYSSSTNRILRTLAVLLFSVMISVPIHARTRVIPSPKEDFGFNMGDDYTLATYSQTEAYFRKLSGKST
jgi:hypothetical protein